MHAVAFDTVKLATQIETESFGPQQAKEASVTIAESLDSLNLITQSKLTEQVRKLRDRVKFLSDLGPP